MDSFVWSGAFANTETSDCPVTYTVHSGDCSSAAPNGITFVSSSKKLSVPTHNAAGYSSEICVKADNGHQTETAKTTVNLAS